MDHLMWYIYIHISRAQIVVYAALESLLWAMRNGGKNSCHILRKLYIHVQSWLHLDPDIYTYKSMFLDMKCKMRPVSGTLFSFTRYCIAWETSPKHASAFFSLLSPLNEKLRTIISHDKPLNATSIDKGAHRVVLHVAVTLVLIHIHTWKTHIFSLSLVYVCRATLLNA